MFLAPCSDLTADSTSVSILDMAPNRYLVLYSLLFFILLEGGSLSASAEKSLPAATVAPPAPAQEPTSIQEEPSDETIFYGDRFIFRSKSLDDLVIVLLIFERGQQSEGYYGEFFGAIFEKNRWAFFEGNAKYSYASSDLKTIFPYYYAKVNGTASSGFVLTYDGGDYTLKLSSGSVQPGYQAIQSDTLKKQLGIAEAVLSIHEKEIWGDLVHESLVWQGFEGLKRYDGLYEDYQAFYLKTESGKQFYFHKNHADRQKFLKKYQFSDALPSEGGAIFKGAKTIHSFKTPIAFSETSRVTPPFSFYTIPERWEVDLGPEIGSLFLWSRDETSVNWLLGGYFLMAIEGVIKNGAEEERIWGFAEYFP